MGGQEAMKKQKWIWLLGLFTLLLSCVRENDVKGPVSSALAEGQKLTISFTVEGPAGPADTKALDNGGDIQNLYVAVFGSSGYLKEYVKATQVGEVGSKTYTVEKVVETGPNETEIIQVPHTVPLYTYSVQLTITDSPRRIHFLGNGPASLPFGYDTAVMPLQMSQLSESGVGEKAYWQMIDLPNGIRAKRNSNDNYIDINGVEYGQPGFAGFIPDPSLTALFQEIPLIRNWAKIVLFASSESNFTPKSLAVVNFPSRGTIAPYSAQTGFVRNYQNLGFEDLQDDLLYPASLPAGTVFDSSMPDADAFKASSFVDGGRVAGASTKEQIDSDTEDSGSAVYLYERPAPSESIPPTYVIIYGHYRNEEDLANEGDYFYKVDLMEAFLNSNNELDYRYYPIFRNFKYQIMVRRILSRGHDTPEAASVSAGSADVSADITTGHLADISDGVGRLHLTWMQQTFISEHDASHPVEDLHVFFSKTPDGAPDLDPESVDVKLFPPADGGASVITSFVKGDPVNAPGSDNHGWRQISFTTAAPGKTIRSQTMRITGKYESGRLYRDVVVTVQPIQPMWVQCGKERVNAIRGVEQSVIIGIPEGLPKNMFPLSFNIEAQDLTLTPDNSKPNNNLPVVSGTSISTDDGYAGKATFHYVRTLSWDEYRTSDIYESDDDKTWRTVTCYFKTNCPQNATKIWVKSQYFETVNTRFYNYDYGLIHDGEIPIPIPRKSEERIPFHFQVEPMDEGSTFPELTLVVRGLINDADSNPGVSSGGYLDEYVYTPTSIDNTLYFITTNSDGDLSLSISAPGYNNLVIKPFKFNRGITQPWSYGLLEAQKAGSYWSNVAFGKVQIKKWNESSPSNRGVIFAYFDDPDKPLARVTLRDPSGKIITNVKNANNSGLIAVSPSSYPYTPGTYSTTSVSTYHELYLSAYSAQEYISFELSSPGYVTESYSYGRLSGRVGLHSLTMDASSINKWYNSSTQTMMPPNNSSDNTYVHVTVEALDGAPAPVVNANGMLLGEDKTANTLPGGRYKITFTSGDVTGISGMNSQLKNQRFYFCQFELNPNYHMPASVTPEKGTYFPFPGSDRHYNWVAFDNTSEYSIVYDPLVHSRYIVFEVSENQPVLITSLFIKTISNVPGT